LRANRPYLGPTQTVEKGEELLLASEKRRVLIDLHVLDRQSTTQTTEKKTLTRWLTAHDWFAATLEFRMTPREQRVRWKSR